MVFYTEEEFQNNFDEYMDRIQGGESIGIVANNGFKAVFVPIVQNEKNLTEEELVQIYTNHNEAQ